MPATKTTIDLLDISSLDYASRLTANSLQGLVNRKGAYLFLDYGIYDDPGTRTTNSVQMTEDNWFGKYRDVLKRNDLDNLDFYTKVHKLDVNKLKNLEASIGKYKDDLKGFVIWDPGLIESVNLALMYSGLESLLVVHPDQLKALQELTNLPVVQDLRGRFTDRVSLYKWAFKNLFNRCKTGQAACMEPQWHRAEFTDYIVQNKLFVYSLAAHKKGGVREFGKQLLLLLIAGPFGVRNLLFNTRLDGFIRWIALGLQRCGAPEVCLGQRIQRAVKAEPYPTLFGWHSDRDDEFALMLQVSANGMRLAPTFMANNYSFHSKLPQVVPFKQNYIDPGKVKLEEDKVYLTFTLSDGDQFTLMNTAEVGNWRRPEHGKVPFNWEVQPLLAEIAPALLGYYYSNLTPNDMLIAGPSGAGYVIPPLVANLPAYLQESSRLCNLADIRITTSYTGDPAMRVVRQHGKAPGNFLGFLSGYFQLGRTPMYMAGSRPLVSNTWPTLEQIGYNSDIVIDGVRKLLDIQSTTPRFIACHLFAYCTTVKEIYDFVKTLDPNKVKVVRADEFLLAAAQFMQKEKTT